MSRCSVLLLFALIDIIIPSTPLASDDWKLVIDEAGVKVYFRKVKGLSEAEFKGVSIVKSPISVVGAVLADIPAYTRWFYNCREVRKIPSQDSTDLDFLLYVAVKTPWPISDRDVVYRAITTIDKGSGKVMVNSVAQAEALIPVRPKYVRITDSIHRWILERITPDQTRVTLINRTDPAGSLTSFLADRGNRMTTYESLKNMREIVKDPRYAGLGQKLYQQFEK